MPGKAVERDTSAEFVGFLNDIVVNRPICKEVHVIADKLSTRKTKRVDAFLAVHSNVDFHFTPTCSSWLNRVDRRFAKIERDVIARGVFTSVPDLRRKLMRYIRQYNKQAKSVKWKYFDPSRRIAPDRHLDAGLEANCPGAGREGTILWTARALHPGHSAHCTGAAVASLGDERPIICALRGAYLCVPHESGGTRC